MKRRDFLSKVSAATLAVSIISATKRVATGQFNPFQAIREEVRPEDLASLSSSIRSQFQDIMSWMKENGWIDYLNKQTGLNLNTTDPTDPELFRKFTMPLTGDGLNDFAGIRAIEPGLPSMSLLYHALASPRAKPAEINSYPDYEQLDKLENYIYSLQKWNEQELNQENIFLAVLSYEYRPAYKTPRFFFLTPDKAKHADLVFSRTGIARIGNKSMNYDAANRSYTNLPAGIGMEKHIAVTPARYGLFLVELVTIKNEDDDKIVIMNPQANAETTREKRSRHFIRPIRKIFNDDNIKITFSEYHLNEKLHKLSKIVIGGKQFDVNSSGRDFDIEKPPFKKISAKDDTGKELAGHNTEMVNLKRNVSSVLLSSIPDELVRECRLQENIISFHVDKRWQANHISNRRYTTYKVTDRKSKDVNDAIITDFIFRRDRRTSRFSAPRNAPLFVNIRNEVTAEGITYLGAETRGFEQKIEDGNYRAQIFEDSICDGCIAADIQIETTSSNSAVLKKLTTLEILPAFSLVTAPDFFPYVDGNDIRAYYKESSTMDEHFLEGGTINLSGIRLRGNPDLQHPIRQVQAFAENEKKDPSFDTITAVVSAAFMKLNEDYKANEEFLINFKRDYKNTSYLPDTGSGIFFPGWDATYSGEAPVYLATFGLGFPFPEDMKLCAAANGMWPVASPDAGRTFQGSLDKIPFLGKPATSVPLMDNEIGYHAESPFVKEHNNATTFGWDGEQGPFLHVLNEKLYVNFSDIGRADYVKNILDANVGFNMQLLRDIESSEIINRMECLRKTIRAIDNRKVEFTKLWLISAEKVNDWTQGAPGYGIPRNLIGNNNSWATNARPGISGSGYLFVFADAQQETKEELKAFYDSNRKRRTQVCRKIYICQVTPESLAWCKLPGTIKNPVTDLKWIQV
ncbi:MAG: hypothetical protein WCF67_17830 [Chitinophagaceae bacterium]